MSTQDTSTNLSLWWDLEPSILYVLQTITTPIQLKQMIKFLKFDQIHENLKAKLKII